MSILEMVLPRLELMASLASDREVVRDPVAMAELRESYRYMASVCRNLLPTLEEGLAELPDGMATTSPIEEQVSRHMALIRCTNRLHRAVQAHLEERAAARGRIASSSLS